MTLIRIVLVLISDVITSYVFTEKYGLTYQNYPFYLFISRALKNIPELSSVPTPSILIKFLKGWQGSNSFLHGYYEKKTEAENKITAEDDKRYTVKLQWLEHLWDHEN